ncbi:MAG: glycoside hydrolase family 16 protein [Acidobacteria bacterium]|nr:glycoside hydrolase family 16 protein [Acidobacteriota bacterium]
MEEVAGKVRGASKGQRVVLFARSGIWWVQPKFREPFTAIEADGSWKSRIHLGTEYAALLVDEQYVAPRTTDVLPEHGGGVLAMVRAPGRNAEKFQATAKPKTVSFSGYEWDVVQEQTDSAGVMHQNSASNVWTDDEGRLHMRIRREGEEWLCSEVSLRRSLGYGRYSFVLSQAPVLEPGTVLGMFTWDPLEAGQNHREIDVELSQWGDPKSKNAQFVIQPYYVPANVFRFQAQGGPATHSFQWEAERVSFQSVSRPAGAAPRTIAEHVFSSGIPAPGGERVHINLYVFGKTRTPQKKGVEVVIDKFEYLP